VEEEFIKDFKNILEILKTEERKIKEVLIKNVSWL